MGYLYFLGFNCCIFVFGDFHFFCSFKCVIDGGKREGLGMVDILSIM